MARDYVAEFAGKTPEELRAEARRQRQSAEDSFQRCDTDGFLSQWALGIGAQLYEAQAEIIENGNMATTIGLYEGDRRVKAKLISRPAYNAPWITEYVWLLHRSEAVYSERRFIPEGAKSRIQKKFGFSERPEMRPAHAAILGSGKGLSGAASAYVGPEFHGDEWGQDAVLIPEKAA